MALLMRTLEQEEQQQQQASTEREGQEIGHWLGCVPYLQIIICLTQDDVMCPFLTKANTRSQDKLDVCYSDSY
jgi:hypothetical protein